MLKFMAKEGRELEIQYYMRHLSDLIPYDDPEYGEKLRMMASAAVQPWDDDLIALCEDHDKLLDDGLLDF